MTEGKRNNLLAVPLPFRSLNHLKIDFYFLGVSDVLMENFYNAIGEKVQKKVTNGANILTTDYLGGFQYNDDVLEFFPHPEGYVKATLLNPINNKYAYNYVYNYTDHLGNIRLSYTKDPQTGNLKILDESHYYPFGLKHQEYVNFGFVNNPIQGVIIAPILNNPYKYKFGNKEYQDELGLNWYDYGARMYMPDITRWGAVDPLAEHPKQVGMSPYAYAANNPMRYIDPTGMIWEDPKQAERLNKSINNRIEK